MLKKLLILIAALLPSVAFAQMATGEWYTYPTFTSKVSSMIESPAKLYFQDDNCLFSYDKETSELYSYTKRNLLSDNGITNIFYNYDNHYLLVVYENSNIDLIYEDGNVVNLSDIMDAVLMTAKNVNDVAFYKNRIYVATDFGLVVFDDKRYNVIESGIYNYPIKKITVYKDNIIMFTTDENGAGYMAYSPVSTSHYNIASFKKFQGGITVNQFLQIGDNDGFLYALNNGNVLRKYTFDFNAGTYNTQNVVEGLNKPYAWYAKDKSICVTDSKSQTISKVKEGAVTLTVNVPANLQGNYLTTYNNLNNVWVFTYSDGIGCYNIQDSTPTVLVTPMKPDACTVDRVAYLTPSLDGERIYVGTIGPSNYKEISKSRSWTWDGLGDEALVNIIENGGVISDVTPKNVTASTAHTQFRWTQEFGGRHVVVAPTHIAEDPLNPDTYYIGSYTDGVYKIKNGVEVGHYTADNSPMLVYRGSSKTWGGLRAPYLTVDRQGNLIVAWVKNHPAGYYGAIIHRLPAAKLALPSDQVTADDWEFVTQYDIDDYWRDGEMLVCRNSPMVFILQGYYYTNIIALNTETGEVQHWRNITDQDGKDVSLTQFNFMAEDNQGRVWLGGDATGIIRFDNPVAMTNPNTTCTKVKVPRNDGTDYADYLLDTESVRSISVDPSGRVWFATNNSGAYLVSPEGDEIISHFTTSNSDIPDDQINAVYADRLSNRVYFGTNYGLAVYNSDSSPAADDYNNVYAFPNPVRPDYTGWITISGLMDNSLVKICDAMGNTLRSGNSEGGMFMWDGCDTYGNRVKSGVYYVMASQSNEDSHSGKVATKILVVN